MGVNGQPVIVDRTLAAKYFSGMDDLEENPEVIPLELFSENGAQTPTKFSNLIQWIKTYEAHTLEDSNSKFPPITADMLLIADTLNLKEKYVQPFYEQAAKTLTFEDVFKIMNTSLNAALNYIKSNPLAFYNHLNEAETKLSQEGYQAYLAKLKEDTKDAILNLIPLSQLMKLNPEVVMHHVSVTETEARAWQENQADVNAFFTKFPNTPLVIDFGNAETIEDDFGGYGDISTFPEAIKRVIIKGDKLTTVGDNFLPGCKGLIHLELPQGITTVGNNFLALCLSLTQLEIPKGITTVGGLFLFRCSSLTHLEFPQGLTTVGQHFLSGCTGLTQLELPQNLTTVGNFFLAGCTGLTQLELPQNLTTVGNNFLSGCKNLQTVLAHKIMPAWDDVKAQIGDKLMEIH